MVYDVIPGFKEYMNSLPPEVREQILASGVEITSLGELMQVAEHLKAEL